MAAQRPQMRSPVSCRLGCIHASGMSRAYDPTARLVGGPGPTFYCGSNPVPFSSALLHT
jgi:hypothetical protein